ncbi:hypothetical protein D3C71_194970 [compost metagenome]
MKKTLIAIGAVLLVGLVVMISGCSRVKPNYVGVLMENYGKAGKGDFSLVKGRVQTWAPGTELFQVPLFEQRARFEKSVGLKAADNTQFTSSPSYSYSVIEQRAVDVVFQNKQIDNSGDEFMRSLEDNILEPKIYDIMKEASRKFITDSLMATGGSLRFEEYVQRLVAEEFERRGLQLTTFSSQLEFSEKVTAKIDNRNEVNTNISVLDQQIEEQKKRNELAELQAQESIIRSKGITKEILEEMAIQKWDGKLPATWSGSTLPFVKTVN